MKLVDYVAVEPLAASIVADARALGLVPSDPGWVPEHTAEPYSCQVNVFSTMAGDYDRMDLETIRRSFDCLYFTPEDNAWLPAWMCASLYAVLVRGRDYGNLVMTTEYALVRALREDRLPIRIPTLRAFASRVLDVDDSEEFYAALRDHEAAQARSRTTDAVSLGRDVSTPPED